MPQNPLAKFDADAEPVRRDTPRLRHLRKKLVEVVVGANAERIHDTRHQRIAERGVVVDQIIHVLRIRRNRGDEAVAGNGVRIKELRVRHRNIRIPLFRCDGSGRAERGGRDFFIQRADSGMKTFEFKAKPVECRDKDIPGRGNDNQAECKQDLRGAAVVHQSFLSDTQTYLIIFCNAVFGRGNADRLEPLQDI